MSRLSQFLPLFFRFVFLVHYLEERKIKLRIIFILEIALKLDPILISSENFFTILSILIWLYPGLYITVLVLALISTLICF
jgi:hypothetical protein